MYLNKNKKSKTSGTSPHSWTVCDAGVRTGVFTGEHSIAGVTMPSVIVICLLFSLSVLAVSNFRGALCGCGYPFVIVLLICSGASLYCVSYD